MYNAYNQWFPSDNCTTSHNPYYASTKICAWIEGWADFMSAAIGQDRNLTYPSGAHYRIEPASIYPSDVDKGDNVEIWIARALLDLMDDNPDCGYIDLDSSKDSVCDITNQGFSTIWDILWNQNQSTFSDFWTHWKDRGLDKHYAVQAIAMNTINYDAAPTLSGLPDKNVYEAQSLNNVFDLDNYASDFESSDAQLIFYVVNNTSPNNVKVSVNTTHGVDIVSLTYGWSSWADITIRVTDNIKYADDTFRVTVVNTAPSAPTGVEAELRIFNKDGTYTGDGVRVKWNKNPELDMNLYYIYRNWTGSSPSSTTFNYYGYVTHIDGSGIHTFIDTNVSSGKTYSYKITAIDKGNRASSFSNISSVYVPASGGSKIIVAGLPQSSEYLVQREGYYQYGDNPEETVDYHSQQLIYQISGLNKDKKYSIALDYNGGGDSTRIQTTSVDNIPIHINYKVPGGFDFTTKVIPRSTYNQDGEIEITITKEEGPNAIIADIIIWEDKPSNNGNPNPIITKSLPKDFSLSQNYPNPFNPETTIEYTLPKSEHISLSIYNLKGQLVKTLVNERKSPGYYNVRWEGKDNRGNQVSSGIYFYTIKAGSSFTSTKKMLLIK